MDLSATKWDDSVSLENPTFTPLPAGAYVCQIINAHVEEREGEKIFLTLDVDIAKGDFAGYFGKLKQYFNSDWPYDAQFKRYITTEHKAAYTAQFMRLIKILEKENDNFRFDPSKFAADIFIGYLCGFTFGEREYVNKNNQIAIAPTIGFAEYISDVESGKCRPPKRKTLPPERRPDNNIDSSEFSGVPVPDSEMPF